MDQSIIDGIEKMMRAGQKADESMQEGTKQIVEAIRARSIAFGLKKNDMEKDMENGARLTATNLRRDSDKRRAMVRP